MKQSNKTTLIVIFTVIVTSAITSYIVNKQTVKAMANAVRGMQAFNEIAKVEAWDNIENLINKGCTKKALYYVKLEQASSLSSIKLDIGNNMKTMDKIKKRNPDVAKRAQEFKKSYNYTVPACK